MDEIVLGEIIATRNLDLIRPDGSPLPVVVHIGKPRQFPGSTDYFAPYQITGAGREEVWYAGGVDSVQSLQLVMGMINAELTDLKSKLSGELRWVGDDAGGLGFE
jgi:hypothetical protein